MWRTHLLPDATATTTTPNDWCPRVNPLPGCELRIVDPATLQDLPAGEHGEIWLRTPQLMKGYLNQPEETAG